MHGWLLLTRAALARGDLERGEVFAANAEEIARRLVRKYLGEEGDQYIDALLQDGKPGKNRVIVKIKRTIQ